MTMTVSMQVGMLTLMSAVLKHNPVFKHQPEGQVFVGTLFEFLFKLPSSQEKLHPVCKSQLSRTACYDLLGELVRGCTANYTALHQLLIAQHQVVIIAMIIMEIIIVKGELLMMFRLPATNHTPGSTGLGRRVAASAGTSASSTSVPPATWPPPSSSSS